MGCDIHIFLERKNNENHWVDSMIYENDEFDGFESLSYYPRNYTLFATLAGVRGDNPIANPRGIPEDCSLEYKKMCDDWGDDGHSHSYFTLRELLDITPKCSEFKESSLNEFVLYLKKIIKIKNFWISDEDIEEDAENYRVCFFFDN